MTTIQAGTSPASAVNDMGARLRRNGIDPENVYKVDVLPLRIARIHEYALNERGAKYLVYGPDGQPEAAKKRPHLRWLPRR